MYFKIICLSLFLNLNLISFAFSQSNQIQCLDLTYTGINNISSVQLNNKETGYVNIIASSPNKVNLNYNNSPNVINSYNKFKLASYNFSLVSSESNVVSSYSLFDQQDSNLNTAVLNASQIEPAVIDFLAYPNPAKLSTGVEIGYELSKPMDIELHIYNMLARLIYKNSFPAGALGAQGNGIYNRLNLDLSTLNNFELSSGVYYVFLIHQGKKLGKLKIAIVP